MAGAEQQQNLFPDPPQNEATIFINDRCLIQTAENARLVIVSGLPLAQYPVGDKMAEAHAMVSLVEQGWADQDDVARAFGCSARTVRRYERRFGGGGLAALGRERGYPSGRRRISASREQLVLRLKAQGQSNHEIARRLGVTPKAARKLLKRLGWRGTEPEQPSLPIPAAGGDPKLSAFSAPSIDRVPEPAAEKARPAGDPKLSAFPSADDEPIPLSFDTDPSDRRVDRVLAYLGLLDDAAPLFRSSAHVPRAGVLLALPALVDSGVFTIARKI